MQHTGCGCSGQGIPEVVVHNETGLLVPFAAKEDVEPGNPEENAADLAAAINSLIQAPGKRGQMGAAARKRIEKHFSWPSIARQTVDYYQDLIKNHVFPGDTRHLP